MKDMGPSTSPDELVEVAADKRLVLAIEHDAKVDILHACGRNAS